MKILLILMGLVVFSEAKLITESEKEETVRGDLFQIKYRMKSKAVQMQLSGYKLAEIDWENVELRVYSLNKQVKEFAKFTKENPNFEISPDLIPNQATSLEFKIQYNDQNEVLAIPLN